jgi:hypothetical protein
MKIIKVLLIPIIVIVIMACEGFNNPLSSESGGSEQGSGGSEQGSGGSEQGSGTSEHGSGGSEQG